MGTTSQVLPKRLCVDIDTLNNVNQKMKHILMIFNLRWNLRQDTTQAQPPLHTLSFWWAVIVVNKILEEEEPIASVRLSNQGISDICGSNSSNSNRSCQTPWPYSRGSIISDTSHHRSKGRWYRIDSRKSIQFHLKNIKSKFCRQICVCKSPYQIQFPHCASPAR